MPSAIYGLFAQAMKERKQVHCTYHERSRVVCPIILGHTGGEEMALIFQVGGKSSHGLGPEGEWRCFHLNEVTDVELHDGPWRAVSSHLSWQHCVEDVDLDVNPDSPYSPRRRL
jgi:predicted DNA-binding transcriptional regulator YafY